MDDVKEILIRVWDEFQKKEGYLFENDLSERCISFNFAKYLSLAEEFKNYNVDCEYNREYNKELSEPKQIKIIKDNFSERIKNGEISTYDEVEKYRVYPDIIIHKRGSCKENFIVIEMKKNTQDSNAKEYDYKKLKAYKKEPLDYQFAFFIEFGVRDDEMFNIVEIEELK